MRINSVPDVKCFCNNKNVLVHNQWYDISCATLYVKNCLALIQLCSVHIVVNLNDIVRHCTYDVTMRCVSATKFAVETRGELSYLAPLGSENISAPYFKQCFFQEGGIITPQTESKTTPPSPKTEITNILFYILNFASIIKFKM